MSITNKISEMNPFAIIRRKRMRNELKNKNVTFLCPNCIGGILFHDLGLKFLSPTVNLMMLQNEFVEFVLHFDEYVNADLQFYKHGEYNCPCAYLLANSMKKITVHFTHYTSEEIALRKWKERIKRIQKNNIFVFLCERDDLTVEQIKSLASINVKGLVVFTANEYKDIPYAVWLKKYEAFGKVGNILKKSYLNDSREYEKYFDFIKWFNEADGNNYDVSRFKR